MSGERPKQTGRERADAQRKRAQAQKGQRHEQDSSLPPWLLPVGLAVVALAVGSGLYLSNQANQPIIHPATPGLADTIGPELQTGDIMPATMDAFAQVLQIQPADIGDPNKFSQTISDLIYGSKINKPLPKAVQLPK